MTALVALGVLVLLVTSMVATFLVAMSLSKSMIQASEKLAASSIREVRLSRVLLRTQEKVTALERQILLMRETMEKLDSNVAEMALRLSAAGHLRTKGPPQGLGPRGSWQGGRPDDESGRSATPA